MAGVTDGGKAKKLIGAVEHWHSGGKSAGESLDDQAAALGIELPESMRPPANYEVWPEHEAAVLTFLRCQTQWRTIGEGVIGLDYGVVLGVMRLYDVPSPSTVLEDVQVMESRAVELLNHRPQKGAKSWR